MKISSLTYKNFKGIKSLSVDFPEGKPVVLTGPNGTGKTSALQGLQFVLLGGNPGDLNRMDGLLRVGAKKGHVAITLDEGTITRHIKPHRIDVPGMNKPKINEAQLEICNILGCRKRHIELCLRPDLFMALQAKDQRLKLWDLLGLKLTDETVREYLEKNFLTEAYLKHRGQVSAEEIPRNLMEMIAKRNEHLHKLEKLLSTIDADIDAAYSVFYADRTAAKKDLKKAEDLVESMQDEKDSGKAPKEVDRPSPDQLNRAAEKMQTISRQLGAAEEARKNHERNLQRVQQMEASFPKLPGWTLEQAEERLATLKKEAEALQGVGGQVGQIRTEISRLKAETCYGCGQKWPDLDERLKRRQELEAQLKQAEEKAAKLSEILGRIKAGNEKIQDYKDKVRALEEFERLKSEAAAYEPPECSVTEEDLRKARADHQRLSEGHQLYETWRRWSDKFNAAKRKVKELEKTVEELQALVNLFGPNGIKFQVFKEPADKVAEHINSVLELWDMACRFNGELELEICRSGVWRLLDAASDGERLLTALAIQVWVADFTGLRIVCLDRLEALDRKNFDLLIGSLAELLEAKAIDHALVVGVDLQPDPRVHNVTLTLN